MQHSAGEATALSRTTQPLKHQTALGRGAVTDEWSMHNTGNPYYKLIQLILATNAKRFAIT